MNKILPQALDLEEAILGAILLEKDAIDKISSLRAEHFYSEVNKIIFETIYLMAFEGKPIDILTLVNELKAKNKLYIVGGAIHIATLTNKVTSSANIQYHSRVIQQMYIQRELIITCQKTIQQCYDNEDVFKVSDNHIQAIENTFNTTNSNSAYLAYDILVENINERKKTKGIGLEVNLKNLDSLTNGFQKGNLIILAARPAMGKTAFSLQLARNVSKDHKNCLFFSLEMSKNQLVSRVESAESGIYSKKIDNGALFEREEEQLNNAHKKIRNMGLYIDDTTAISIQQMKLKAKRQKRKYGLDLIIVDYIQLAIGDNSGNREQEISSISRGLKLIAKELEVPVIALSQLSRAVESRSDKRPMLSDLRESGAIEQDADMVMFLFREKYYKKDLKSDETELIIAKNRSGNLHTLFYEFHGNTMTFNEIKESTNIDNQKYNPFEDVPF